jgi:hypothetical protein
MIRVDHVEQYKIPREYLNIEEDEDLEEKNIYKPTGPDGKGWGEDRILSNEDEENFKLIQQEEMRREQRGTVTTGKNYIMDEDERVYIYFESF